MTDPIRILIQTTIPYTEDDWHVGRFGLLREALSGLTDAGGDLGHRPAATATRSARRTPYSPHSTARTSISCGCSPWTPATD